MVQPQKHSILDVLVVRQSETVSAIITGTATSLLTGTVIAGQVRASYGQGNMTAMSDTCNQVCSVIWVLATAGLGGGYIGTAAAGLTGIVVCIAMCSSNTDSGGTIGHSNAVTP